MSRSITNYKRRPNALRNSVRSLAAAIAMAGLPPLSGFIGKLLILDAARDSTLSVWIWTVILVSSLISILGFARAGSIVFWKAKSVEDTDDDQYDAPQPLAYVAVGGLLTLLAAHTVFAGYAHDYVIATSEQLFAPEPYISTVVDTPGKLSNSQSEEY